MRKKLMVLLSVAMLFNSLTGLTGYAETATDEVSTVSAEEENIKRETGTTTVAATTNEWWMGNDKTAAQANVGDYIAEALNVVGGNRLTAGSDVFVGYQMKKSTDSAPSYIVLKDPDGAYLKTLMFYAYYRGTSASDACIVSVSDTLAGPYTTVSTVSTERVGNLNNTNTHSIWKHTVTDIEAKYVKITSPSASFYPVIGAFTYDWLKITDLSQLPDGTNKVCGTTNPYWLADSTDDVLKPFSEYTVAATYATASYTVTADDITASNGAIAGNPINSGDRSFVGVRGNGAYAIVKAPENSFIRRFKFHAYNVGGEAGFDYTLAVSNEINGTYTPVTVTKKKIGYISGMPTNHFIYAIETAEQINCKYVKITLSSGGYPKLGSFEYDYKINKVGIELDKIFYTYNDILDGQDRMHVENDLNLPDTIELSGTKYDGEYNIEWSASDSNIISSDGTVNQPTQSKAVTVNANVTDSGGNPVYTKSYDITVAALGSTLVLRDDFEGATLDESTGMGSVNGYNDWVSTNTAQTKSAILKDPANAGNKVLWVHREDATADSDSNQKDYEAINSGKLELSFKHMINTGSTQSRFGWCGMDIYMRAAGFFGYVSGTPISFKNQKSVTWKMGVWHEYRLVIDIDRDLLDIYFDGEQILDDCVLPSAAYKSSGIGFNTKRNANYGSSYFDDVCIRNLTPSDEDAIKYDADLIKLPETTVNDLELPTTGDFDSIIAWDSSNTDVIDNNGVVTQGTEDTDVILHATVARGDYVEERNFTVKVLGTANTNYVARDEDAIKGIAEKFPFDKMLDGQSALNITDDIAFVNEYSDGDAARLGGCNISWSSSNTDVLKNNGEIIRGENDVKVTLTAEFAFKEAPDVKTEKSYTVIIAGEGEYEYLNTFSGAKFGKKASELGGVSVTDVADSGVFYGAWQSPTDLLNGVLGVTRTKLASIDKDAVLATDYAGKIAEAGFSFYLSSPADRLDISFDGVDIPVYIKSDEISVDGAIHKLSVPHKQWHKFVIRFDDYNKWYHAYLDGELINTDAMQYKTDFSIDTVTISNDSTSGTIGAWYADDVFIRNADVSDADAIERTIAVIDIADRAEWNIELPKIGKFGAQIEWESENEDVLTREGIVTRTVGPDKTITLTATVSRGDVVREVPYDVLVPGLTGTETPTQEKFEEHVSAIDITELTTEKPTEITKDLDLFGEYMTGNCAFYGGMDVTWSSELPKIISDNGEVTRPAYDKGVTLTATFTSKRDTSVTAQKEFDFIVLAPYELICYEDFDDITEDMAGTNIDGYKNWTFEKQLEVNKSMIADLEIDPADRNKPFSEANKAFRISRWRNSAFPERAHWNFTATERTAMLEADAVAFSFRIKFINTASQMDLAFGGLGGVFKNGSITSGVINGGFTTGAFAANEWHTLTFIIAPTNKTVYFMIDGNKGFSVPYKEFNQKLSVSYLELHTFRKRGQSDYYIDDISIRILKDSDEAAVEKAVSELELPQMITDTVTLPSFGAERTNITWTSDSHDVVLDSGEIVGTGDALLTAIIKRGKAQATKAFNVSATKTDSYDFAVNNITVSDGKISGADVSYTGNTTDAELIVLVYNNGRIASIRNADVTGTNVTFDPVDVSELYNCEVKAYIKRNSDLISNVLTTKLQ